MRHLPKGGLPATKKITVTQLRYHLGATITDVRTKNERVAITRQGNSLAVIVPLADYAALVGQDTTKNQTRITTSKETP